MCVVGRHAPAPGERVSVSILQEYGWDPGQVWTGTKNLAPPPHPHPPGFDLRTVHPAEDHYTD